MLSTALFVLGMMLSKIKEGAIDVLDIAFEHPTITLGTVLIVILMWSNYVLNSKLEAEIAKQAKAAAKLQQLEAKLDEAAKQRDIALHSALQNDKQQQQYDKQVVKQIVNRVVYKNVCLDKDGVAKINE